MLLPLKRYSSSRLHNLSDLNLNICNPMLLFHSVEVDAMSAVLVAGNLMYRLVMEPNACKIRNHR